VITGRYAKTAGRALLARRRTIRRSQTREQRTNWSC